MLHLGDFIYEVVQYPEEAATRYDRTIVEIVRLAESIKVGNFHLPVTLEGYRSIYRAYLRDPDIQAARARWPFVAMWDNHEFSWQGWQSMLKGGSVERPAQTIKVAANQAWFEYQPARISKPERPRSRPLRSARRCGRAAHRFRRERPQPGTQQSRRDWQPDRLPGAALRPPSRSDHHRSVQLQDAASVQFAGGRGPGQPAPPPGKLLPRRGGADSRCRPHL